MRRDEHWMNIRLPVSNPTRREKAAQRLTCKVAAALARVCARHDWDAEHRRVQLKAGRVRALWLQSRAPQQRVEKGFDQTQVGIDQGTRSNIAVDERLLSACIT